MKTKDFQERCYEIQQNPHKVEHIHDGEKREHFRIFYPKKKPPKLCEWGYGYICALMHSTHSSPPTAKNVEMVLVNVSTRFAMEQYS